MSVHATFFADPPLETSEELWVGGHFGTFSVASRDGGCGSVVLARLSLEDVLVLIEGLQHLKRMLETAGEDDDAA